MEEEPTAIAPDLEAEKEFIIKNEANESVEPEPIETTKATKKNEAPEPSSDDDEFDLSDISHMPQDLSREDIIAAAEAAAYES
jgi:ribonuclease-3